ncbi:MAG: TetR/AcrR family transcriptional regulator [Cyclobacteriaceae bacterium]|nr:TetR/AcrR family transcriptional regulator [Cyclobacteriaceae bacterium]
MNKAKKTKRYITERTAEIFNKKGFVGTSLTDLTNATNLTKGSIYGNFQNKEEVAISAFNYNYQYLIKRFASKLSAEKNSKEKLISFLNVYEEMYDDLMRIGGCPILNNAVDTDDTNSKLRSLSVKAFKDWGSNLKSIINAGKAAKEIYDSTDAQYYADLFIATIEGSLMLSKATGEKHYFDHAIQHLQSIIEDVF